MTRKKEKKKKHFLLESLFKNFLGYVVIPIGKTPMLSFIPYHPSALTLL